MRSEEQFGVLTVEGKKLVYFLMNAEHKKGASRWKFLEQFGFRPDQPAVLAQAIIDHFEEQPVVSIEPNQYGDRPHIEGPLNTPSGERPRVLTVWELSMDGKNDVKFLTLIPLAKLST